MNHRLRDLFVTEPIHHIFYHPSTVRTYGVAPCAPSTARGSRSATRTAPSRCSRAARLLLQCCREISRQFMLLACLNTCTGNLCKAVPRLRECCRKVEAEEVSNSRKKIHQTWERPFRGALYKINETNPQTYIKRFRSGAT